MRWLKFNAVGALGMAVHLGSLAFLTHVLHLHYLLATAIAVEAAVLHNFLWHCRWTWKDRPPCSAANIVSRLVRFHAANGLVSVAGNLVLMRLLVGSAGLHPLVAGVLSIIPTSVANYLLSDRLVFRQAANQGVPVACER